MNEPVPLFREIRFVGGIWNGRDLPITSPWPKAIQVLLPCTYICGDELPGVWGVHPPPTCNYVLENYEGERWMYVCVNDPSTPNAVVPERFRK